jgi:pyruvate/2-oxoglutarate dehydrogenase complex dihydrolipoamide acyltransferase (E2) component
MAAGEGMREATDGARVPLIVPDLHVVGPVILSLWLVPRGARVLAGDRVAELLAGAATIDLEAPLAGTLVRQFVDEDDPVAPGTVVAEIVSASGS